MNKLPEDLQAIIDLVAALYKPKFEQPEPLTTPAGIKFWVGEASGKVHGMLFNNDSQCLMYCDDGKVYTVDSCTGFDLARIKECLPLTPCKYEDLVAGEPFFADDTEEVDWQYTAIYLCLPRVEGKRMSVFIGANGYPTPSVDTKWEFYWKIG